MFTGTAGRGWTASIAGEASRTDGTYVIAPEDRGSVDVRAGSDYLSGLAAVADRSTRPGGRCACAATVSGRVVRMGPRCRPTAPAYGRARFDLAVPVGGGQLETYGQLGDQVYRQAFSSIGASRNTETLTVRQRVPASQFGYGLTWRRLFRSIDLLAGAETREIVATNEETAFLPSGPVRSVTNTRGFQRSSGVFAQVRAELGSRTTLVAGARGDLWQRERDGLEGTGVLSPRVSVSHRLAHRVTIRAAFTSSFRPPTLNERYRGFRVGNAVTVANPSLEPEELSSGELGAHIELPRGTLRTTLFAGSLESAITNVTLSSTPQLITRRRENAGTVHASGLETEGEYRVRQGLSLLGSMAFTRSRFVDTPALSGNRVPQVPVWQGTAAVRWTAPGAVGVQVQVRAFGDQFEDDRNTLVLRQAALLDLSLTAPGDAPRRGVRHGGESPGHRLRHRANAYAHHRGAPHHSRRRAVFPALIVRRTDVPAPRVRVCRSRVGPIRRGAGARAMWSRYFSAGGVRPPDPQWSGSVPDCPVGRLPMRSPEAVPSGGWETAAAGTSGPRTQRILVVSPAAD